MAEPEDLDLEVEIVAPGGTPTTYFETIVFDQNECIRQLLTLIRFGSGSPEGVLEAAPGTLYLNSAGGAGTTLYVKESGTGDTGWIGK